MRQPTTILATAIALVSLLAAPAFAQPKIELAGVRTADDVYVALYRYLPEDSADGEVPRATLLLFPDVGMGHRAFDLDGRGLAPFLARRGFEVLVVEHRGLGASEVPLGGYGFEQLAGDAEAVFARVRQERARLFVGGHGLGGTLAMLLAGRHPGEVAGVIGLQAAATLDFPNDPITAALQGLPEAPPWIDLRALAAQPLFRGRSWLEVMLSSDGKVAAETLEALRLYALGAVPRQLVADVAGFMSARAIRVGGVEVGSIIGRYRGPAVLFFAPRDNWIHPECSTPLRDLLTGRVEIRALTIIEGTFHDYSHLSLLFGEDVERDVYEPIVRFLRREAPRR